MKLHSPYHITHVSLDQVQTLPVLNTESHGNYLVFWWHDIALGDLYFKPGFTLTEQSYITKFIEAILPTLEHYSNIHKLETSYWHEVTGVPFSDNWFKIIDGILKPFVSSKSLPAHVPVSVIICTHNRPAQLNRCLQMLKGLKCLPQEIIVVDNAPDDEASKEVVQKYKDVIYVLEPRKGLDIARNTGVVAASMPIVAFADDDVNVHPLWTYKVWETFQDSDTAAMTGLVITADLQTKAQYLFEKYWSFNRGYKDIFYDAPYFKSVLAKGPPVWKIGAGANMAFRKKIFERVGYFDELLDVGAAGCSGDSEMWYRILADGLTIHYNPRAIVFHEHRKEMKGLKKQIYYYMRGHAAAALIQQEQHRQAGYKRYLFRRLPRQYARMITAGFPGYRSRYTTLGSELLGVLSGLIFYFRNRYMRS
ncbi:glycosyltransferase family 2 protein [Pontibacter sp. MBLB2868]|uniref:glycosyltransferase family 2 protein n=1 Tax=Pontibacter sp. MBLB2868 TaxID=3451555 RepID=UPI003F74E5FD